MVNFFKRLYKFISKKYNQLVLDSRAYMFYEIIAFKKETSHLNRFLPYPQHFKSLNSKNVVFFEKKI